MHGKDGKMLQSVQRFTYRLVLVEKLLPLVEALLAVLTWIE
jgi:hypothetical protein